MRFIVETSLTDAPTWCLLDDDGQLLAWAGATYASLDRADQAAHDFRARAVDHDYRTQDASDGRWRWTAWRSEGNRVAVSGHWFRSAEAARAAAGQVQVQASSSVGP